MITSCSPLLPCLDRSFFDHDSNFKIVRINAEPVLSPFEELQTITGEDVIGISETYLNPHHTFSVVNINGFVLHRNDPIGRAAAGGGDVYVRNFLASNVLLSSPCIYSKKPEFLFI